MNRKCSNPSIQSIVAKIIRRWGHSFELDLQIFAQNLCSRPTKSENPDMLPNEEICTASLRHGLRPVLGRSTFILVILRFDRLEFIRSAGFNSLPGTEFPALASQHAWVCCANGNCSCAGNFPIWLPHFWLFIVIRSKKMTTISHKV